MASASTSPSPTTPGTPQIVSAAPDFALALVYLIAWISPRTFQPGVATALMLTLLLEFIVMHSSAFMGTLAYGVPQSMLGGRKRVGGLVALTLMYTLFVAAFCAGFHTWWPLASFWLLTANRLSPLFTGHIAKGEELLTIRGGWAASAVCYLGAVGLTVMLPLPRLGCTPDVVASFAIPSSGLWVEQPWRVFAGGFLYFGAMGLFELDSFRVFRSGIPKDDRFGDDAQRAA